MKIIPVILLLVFSCAVCAQELKEKYAEADGFRQKRSRRHVPMNTMTTGN